MCVQGVVSTVCMIHNCEHFELVFVKVMCKIRYSIGGSGVVSTETCAFCSQLSFPDDLIKRED